jgi:hypothetical protein
MVMVGLAMVMVEMDLEPRKAVNMAEEKKRKIKNVTIAVLIQRQIHLSLPHAKQLLHIQLIIPQLSHS